MIIHSPVLYPLYLCYAHGFAMYNTSNPLRFFSVIIHSPVLYHLYLCYAHGFAVYNTSNPLRFFSVIIHSPNFFSFFCQQKTEKTWLIVHNKRATTVNFKIYNHRSVTYIMESLRLCQGTAVCPEQILCNYIISIQSDILNQS